EPAASLSVSVAGSAAAETLRAAAETLRAVAETLRAVAVTIRTGPGARHGSGSGTCLEWPGGALRRLRRLVRRVDARHRVGVAGARPRLRARAARSGEGRLLDLGCGGGAQIPLLQELGWIVTGVDVSEDQLRIARGRVEAELTLERVVESRGDPPVVLAFRARR